MSYPLLSLIRRAGRFAGGLTASLALSSLACSGAAYAGLTASVTLAASAPTLIYPGETTTLQITLANNNTAAPVTAVAFANSLPGVLPNGLVMAAPATYTCTDPAGPSTTPGVGTLTAVSGTQAISLSGGVIPARANGTDGTCTILLPVTAGTSTGAAATYTYTLASGAVTGDDGAPVANSGSVSQSVNVRALTQPTIAKSFSNSTAVLGGATRTLTITLTNPNPVAIPNFTLADVFPQLSGLGIIRVAAVPAATASCNNGGAAPAFAPVAGDTSLSASGTIPANTGVNGQCTLSVAIEAAHTNGTYSTGVRVNTINAVTQFTNDLGIRAAANATANITVVSPLRITKTVNAGSLATGEAGFFTLTLFNDGSTPLAVTSASDSPIDGVTGGGFGLTVTGSSTTCAGGVTAPTAGDEGVTLTGGTIPAGGSCTVRIDFTGTVETANTPRSYTNTLAAGAVDVGDPAIVSQAASAAVTIYENLNVSKSVSPVNAAPGNPVRYQITVQNWSTADIANLTINDTLADGQTFLTGTIGGIDYTPGLSGTGCVGLSTPAAVGDTSAVFTVGTVPQRVSINTPGSCTVTFWAMTSTAAAGGSAYANSLGAGTVCYAGGTICNGGASNSAGGNVASAVLSVAKTFSQGGTTNPPSALARPEGSVVRMTLTLSNLSANPLANVAISDTLPTSGGNQMRVASPANAASTCGSPTITAVSGSNSLSLNGGTVPARAASGTGAAGTCVVQLDVVGAAGTYVNTASAAATETFADGSTHAVNATSNSATVTYTSSLSATKAFSPATVASGGHSTVTIQLANAGAVALTNVAVTDPLPTGMTVANPANAYTTCAGTTTITAVPGAGSVSLTGADIAGGGNCALLFDVVATGTANWVNTIPAGNISADGGIVNQTPVTGTLTYNAGTALTVAKASNPSTLTFPGQTSQLTLTVTNGTQAVANLGVVDYFTLDGTSGAAANGMVVAATPAASTTCPGGVVTAAPGATQIALAGAALAANAACTVTVNVTSNRTGGITNFIPPGGITTSQGLTNAGQATTSLTTQGNLGITKQFVPNVVQPGERSRLRITLYNAVGQPATGIALVDTLPAGVTVPAGANPTTTCSGATVDAPAADQVRVTGGTLPAASGSVAASCNVEIDVLVAAEGDYVNTIPAGAVSAEIGGGVVTNTQPASDTLHAKSPLTVTKAIAGQTLDVGNPGGFTTGTATRAPGAPATLTIRLANANAAALTGVAFTDVLPNGLVVATTPNASTTCAGGSVIAPASATQVRLSGATVPAAGACTVSVDVLSNVSATYTNTLAAGSVASFEGVSNAEPTRAALIVSTPPTVDKQFSPAVIPPNGISQLTIVLGNDNASAITLTSAFTDSLPTAPGAMLVATPNGLSTTCPGAVTAVAGSASVSYASGASIPAGGCRISVDVTAAVPGQYTNNVPAGALQTSSGNNPQPANVGLLVDTLGYVSGRVFADNNVTPNGVYDAGTDAPLAGATVELRSGPTCAGALLASATTDALGNYLFAGLAAGTYSVCQPAQPAGTANGTTSAGSVTPIAGSTGSAGAASNPSATTSQIVGIVLNGDGAGGEVSGSSGNNFAEILPSSLAGKVFLDQNNNGVQNGADTGIAGVTLELLDAGNAVVATTVTDAAGHYSFTGLAPGTYTLREPAQPAGTSNGLTTAGAVGNGGTAGTAGGTGTLPSVIASIVLPPDTASTGNDFAEIPNGRSLSGRVFLDYDNNGLLDGVDHGLGGLTLNLTGTDSNGNPVTASTTTASDGRYTFSGLPEGTYSVTEPVQPTGTSNGITTVGSTGGVATAVGVTPSVISAIDLTGANLVSADNNFAERPDAAPDLALTKTHAPSSFASGSSTGVFTLAVSNIGTVPTSGTITLTDTLPAGMTVAAPATGTGWACVGAIGASTVSCTTSDVIAAGAAGNPVTLRVAVAAGLSGSILVNTASVSGGGEPPGFDGNNTANDTVGVADAAQVSGTVWRDLNHDRALDNSEPGVAGWRVELLLGGIVVATTTTDPSGEYALTNLAPGIGYQIRFVDPDSGRIWGNAVSNESGLPAVSDVRDSATANPGNNNGNPAGASFGDGTLSGMTLLAGDNIVQQSLPLDPAGVVYDAITRNPVAGAQVTLLNGGVAVPGSCLVGGGNTQTTGASGFYQYLLLNPAPPGCPGSGTYTLQVVQPAGYLPPASTLIPPTAGPYTPTVGGVDAIQPQTTPPTGNAPADTLYYMDFALTLSGVPATSSSDVVNNHIPLDPILGGAIALTKTTPLVNVTVGQQVPYTIVARNTLAAALTNIDVRDTLPPGFKFRAGSATLDGVAVTPTLSGRVLTFPGLNFAPGASRTIKLLLVVGAGVQPGEYINTAQALNPLAVPAAAVSNLASATVRVVPDPTFDCSDLIGKVFDDRNANGYQDDGEPGLPNVRVVTARGWLVTTDAEGRFHIACAAIPDADHGSNFVMKLDERTLPTGYRLTTENPRSVRLTRGKLTKLNFGATIHKVVRLDLSDAAFVPGSNELTAQWAAEAQALPQKLQARPTVLRLGYTVGAEGEALARSRLHTLAEHYRSDWSSGACCHTLLIEEELFLPAASAQGGK